MYFIYYLVLNMCFIFNLHKKDIFLLALYCFVHVNTYAKFFRCLCKVSIKQFILCHNDIFIDSLIKFTCFVFIPKFYVYHSYLPYCWN